MKTLVSILAVLVFCLVLGSYPVRAAMPVANWDAFVNNFVEAYLVSHPAFAVRAGRHEFDGQLPDWSPQAFTTEIGWLKSQRRRAQEFKSASLDEGQLFERDYLISVIDSRLFWIVLPSLHYLLMTLGAVVVVSALVEKAADSSARFLIVFARVLLFFHILLLKLIHALAFGTGYLCGYDASACFTTIFGFAKDYGIPGRLSGSIC